jgi:hypothetical protein
VFLSTLSMVTNVCSVEGEALSETIPTMFTIDVCGWLDILGNMEKEFLVLVFEQLVQCKGTTNPAILVDPNLLVVERARAIAVIEPYRPRSDKPNQGTLHASFVLCFRYNTSIVD